jgi:hypothetical protein
MALAALAIVLILVALVLSPLIGLDLLLSWLFREDRKGTKTQPNFWDPDL